MRLKRFLNDDGARPKRNGREGKKRLSNGSRKPTTAIIILRRRRVRLPRLSRHLVCFYWTPDIILLYYIIYIGTYIIYFTTDGLLYST